MLSFGPFTGINLALYDKIKNYMGWKNDTITFSQSFSLAFSTGIIACIITNPVDVVKVRMQVQRAELGNQQVQGSEGAKIDLSKGRFGYKNVFDGMYKIYKQEGALSLMRGNSARILNLSSMVALNLSTLELFRSYTLNYLDSH